MPKLIVGLGNPGQRYASTRHNIGWMVVDALAAKHGFSLDKRGFEGLYGEMRLPGLDDKVIILKPLTYMNLSGRSAGAAMRFFKVDPADMLVIFDDLDLPPGKLRLREAGGSGGHRGMKSIIEQIGSEAFPRLKIGIGRPAPGWEVPDWVLTPFSADDGPLVSAAMDRAVDAVRAYLLSGIDKSMSDFNG